MVGAAGVDDHDRGRRRPGRRARWRSGRRGLAPGNPGPAGVGSSTQAGRRFGGNAPRRRPGRAHRVPAARRTQIGGEWRATADAPCESASGAGAGDRHHRLQRRPATRSLHCAVDFAGNVGLHARTRPSLVDNNATGPLRDCPACRRRRAGTVPTTSTSPGKTPDQGGEPDRRGLLADRRPGRIRHRRPVRGGPRPDAAAEPLAAARRARTRAQLWLRDEAGNEAPRIGDLGPAAPRRRPPPGVAFAPPTSGPACRALLRADISDEHSGPARGTLYYRRLGADQSIDLPTKLQAGANDRGQAQLTAALPDSLAARGPTCSAPMRLDAAGNVASSTTAASTAPSWSLRRSRRRRPEPGRGAPSRRADGKDARSSPVSAGAVATAHVADRAVRRRCHAQRPAARCRRRGPADRAPADRLARPSRGSAGEDGSQRRSETGPHGGFRLSLPAGPSRRHECLLCRRANGLPPRRRAAALAAGPGAAPPPSTPRRSRFAPARRCGSGGGSGPTAPPLPRRGKLVAIQYLESATGRWRPVLVTRSDHEGRFRARYRFRYRERDRARIRLRAVALSGGALALRPRRLSRRWSVSCRRVTAGGRPRVG